MRMELKFMLVIIILTTKLYMTMITIIVLERNVLRN